MIEASPSAYPSGLLAWGTAPHGSGGDLRRFDTHPHHDDGGGDLPARSLDVGLVNQAGERLGPRHMPAAPEPLRQAVAPDRDGLVGAVACLCTGSWLADLCAPEGRPCVRGHALSMQAMPGGQATHDPRDAPTMAALRRGGRLPQAAVSPAERRATRDLWRRRTPRRRPRAARLAPGHQTTRHDPRPARGQQIASPATRAGVAARVAAPAVPKRVAVDGALLTADDPRLGDRARARVQAATHQEAHPLSLGHTGPGLGTLRSRVRRDARHDLARGPRGQAGGSEGRLGTWAQDSAGTRWGTSGHTLGPGPLTGAGAEAAVLCLRHPPAGPTDVARVEHTPGQGQALTIRAHQPARAVSERRKRPPACDRDTCRQGAGRRAGAPDASRATPGSSLSHAGARSCGTASVHATVRLGV